MMMNERMMMMIKYDNDNKQDDDNNNNNKQDDTDTTIVISNYYKPFFIFINSCNDSSIGRSRHGLLGFPGIFGSALQQAQLYAYYTEMTTVYLKRKDLFARDISLDASISVFV